MGKKNRGDSNRLRAGRCKCAKYLSQKIDYVNLFQLILENEAIAFLDEIKTFSHLFVTFFPYLPCPALYVFWAYNAVLLCET